MSASVCSSAFVPGAYSQSEIGRLSFFDFHLLGLVDQVMQAKARTEDAAEKGPERQLWLTSLLPATPMVSDSDGCRVPISPYLLHKITALGLASPD